MGVDGTMYLWRGTWWPGKPAAIEEKDPAAKIRLLQEDIERQEVRQGRLEKTNEKLKAENKALRAENKMLVAGYSIAVDCMNNAAWLRSRLKWLEEVKHEKIRHGRKQLGSGT